MNDSESTELQIKLPKLLTYSSGSTACQSCHGAKVQDIYIAGRQVWITCQSCNGTGVK